MKNDIYKIDNSIEKILNNKCTYFLDQKEYKLVNNEGLNNLLGVLIFMKNIQEKENFNKRNGFM